MFDNILTFEFLIDQSNLINFNEQWLFLVNFLKKNIGLFRRKRNKYEFYFINDFLIGCKILYITIFF